MPIYEYHCAACDHAFELLQRVGDAAVTLCPVCNQETVTKLVSAAGFQLKGTGWYATDFKNKQSVTKASSSSTEEKKAPEAKSSDSAEKSTAATTKEGAKS